MQPEATTRAYKRWTVLRDQLTTQRIRQHLRQDEVAEAAGLSHRNTVGRVERGEALPSVETYIGIAQAVGLEPTNVRPKVALLLDLPDHDLDVIVYAARQYALIGGHSPALSAALGRLRGAAAGRHRVG